MASSAFKTTMSQHSESSAQELEEFAEQQELLTPPNQPEISNQIAESDDLAGSQALNLYTSHLLSTWNARTYEFAAVRLWVMSTATFTYTDSPDHFHGCGVS